MHILFMFFLIMSLLHDAHDQILNMIIRFHDLSFWRREENSQKFRNIKLTKVMNEEIKKILKKIWTSIWLQFVKVGSYKDICVWVPSDKVVKACYSCPVTRLYNLITWYPHTQIQSPVTRLHWKNTSPAKCYLPIATKGCWYSKENWHRQIIFWLDWLIVLGTSVSFAKPHLG